MPEFIEFKTQCQKYELVPMADLDRDDESNCSSDESGIPLMKKELSCHKNMSRTRKAIGNVKMALKSPLFIVSLLFFQIGVGSLGLAWRHTHRLNARLKDIAMHSPLLDRIEIPLVPRKSYAQYGMGGRDIWRAEPSEEVDKAWESVTAEYLFPVKESDIKAMRKDPSVVVPMPDEYKIDGEITYMAKSAVFHNIHCLDYIRKAVYHDYYYPNGTDDNPFHAHHTAHCIMILFEHLTCSGDPGVYLYRWMEEFSLPIADTNIWRQCWDFETVLEEHSEKAVKDITEMEFRKPPGVKAVSAPDAVMNIIRNYQKTHPDYNPGQ